MILIDALYINGGGGKILLDYLISELEKTDKKVFYLIDSRIKNQIQPIKNGNILHYAESDFQSRRRFYKKNKSNFSTVLCFGNLPPNIKIEATVYTYFHQLLYLKLSGKLNLKSKILYWIKVKVLKSLLTNSDYWMVQTSWVKEGFKKKFDVPYDRIMVLPFYSPLKTSDNCPQREEYTYIYVSNATPHKNHKNLITAFCKFYDKHKKGKLILTVSEDYTQIFGLIKDKINEGYPIKNYGFVERNILTELYSSSRFLIFPSLTESFGLGLIEAIENGCDIIGADLPYTYAVCEPSLTFDPTNIDSIIDAFSLSLKPIIKASQAKISNNIFKIIDILQ